MNEIFPHIVYHETATSQHVFVPAEPPTEPPDPPDPGFGEACAAIEIDGVAHDMRPAEGEELDAYSDPAGDFVQRCIRCTHPYLQDFVAWYRPDADNSREEWIFELGAWPAEQQNWPEYDVTITRRDGTEVALSAPSGHYWFGRWRWQSSPRPVRRSYATLAAQNLIPHLDCSGLATGPILTVNEYQPMATCGMPNNMGSTGAYPGLGILTGWLAQYLVRNAPEDAWRAQAEAINSYPTCIRDPDSHAPLDIINDYPGANCYSSSEGTPYIPKGPSPLRSDQGHLPSTSYIPYLLTGDPYHLESMQLTTNYQQLSLPSDSRAMCSGRYLAWPTRAVAEIVASCPDVVPSWMLPRSYWQRFLDEARGKIEDRMLNNSDPYYYVFHTIPDGGPHTDLDPNKSGDHVWQQSFLDLVAAWVASWRDDWVEAAEWLAHNSIARASATSGWCRARCSPYHMRLQNAGTLAEAFSRTAQHFVLQYPQRGFAKGVSVKIDSEVLVLDDSVDGLTWTFKPRTAPADHAVKRTVYGPKCLSWGEAAELNIQTYDWAEDVADNDHMAPSAVDLTYQGYQLCALAQAITAGLDVPGLRDAFDWLNGECRRLIGDKSVPPLGDNWCVVPAETRRRRHRRSERTDPQHHPRLAEILDAIRGEE